MIKNSIYVVDTSVIIEKKISELVNKGDIKGTIIIPNAILAELENQANQNHTEGFLGLEEIKDLRELAAKKKIELIYEGDKPTELYIRGARYGAIDNLIRDIAARNEATLITGDKVQAAVAEAAGISVILILPSPPSDEKIELEKFFDKHTMSVHIKEDTIPVAKKGLPGNMEVVKLSDKKMHKDEVKKLVEDVIEKTKSTQGAFVEINHPGTTIVQFQDFRIVICKPPFSDGWEITAVRPVAALNIEDYEITEKLMQKLDLTSSGILISGSPGSGKTTFAAALIKHYLKLGRIIKTIESPRDLKVPDEVVQYSKNLGTRDDIHNVMLLSRPDYTFFDEMRTTDDFKLYSDLRLAGIGLAGVVHATKPIDALQRFVGRLDLGVIPQVIDMIIFMSDGKINKVLEVFMKVKVPSGMTESDLARPVIDVKDLETGNLEYEVYTYGEQTVVIPIVTKGKSGSKGTALAYSAREAKQFVSFYFHGGKARAVEIFIDGSKVATIEVARSNELNVHKKSKLGRLLQTAMRSGRSVEFVRTS
ncbi:MAG: Flp pilus assembly complex ATPase component TadA [DPANN group archaeon]|nr:Flp pilus assembly complex ATPase component TadA [DPANN group archaeon]